MNKKLQAMQNKPTIEEALKQKLPLPWKKTDSDGPPVWVVARQRPEQLTADMYNRLKAHKLKENDIRELFYVMNGAWGDLKDQLGVVKSSRLTDIPAKDLPKVQFEVSEEVHVPEPAEVEKFFETEPFLVSEVERVISVPCKQQSLIDCAQELISAVHVRDQANRQIDFYVQEIQRLASGCQHGS